MTTQQSVLAALDEKRKRIERFGVPNRAEDRVYHFQVDRDKQRMRIRRFGVPEDFEHYYKPQTTDGAVRTDTLYVHGVDYLSTDQVTSYFSVFSPQAVEWLNDSSCNVRFPSFQQAFLAYHSNVVTQLRVDDNPLSPAFGYMHDGEYIPLVIRFATVKVNPRQDIKARGIRARDSKYYQWRDGVMRKPITRKTLSGEKRSPCQAPSDLELAVQHLSLD